MTETVNLILTVVSTIATGVATMVTVAQYRREAKRDKEPRPPSFGETNGPTVTPQVPATSIEAPPTVRREHCPSDPLGKVWLALACFPWLNFIAWVWAAMKTGNAKYWLYAVMYALPFLIFGIALEMARAASGPEAEAPTWTAVMGFISWVVGIFHAINTRKSLQRSYPVSR